MVHVEVLAYGDFGMSYTHSVWFNEDLESFDVKALGNHEMERNTDKVIKSLRKLGFRQLKTKKFTVGGGL